MQPLHRLPAVRHSVPVASVSTVVQPPSLYAASGAAVHSQATVPWDGLEAAYMWAHEAVANIEPSALQAQLEHEPHLRQPKSDYTQRYAQHALQAVQSAKQEHAAVLGTARVDSPAAVDVSQHSQMQLPGPWPAWRQAVVHHAMLCSYEDTLRGVLQQQQARPE